MKNTVSPAAHLLTFLILGASLFAPAASAVPTALAAPPEHVAPSAIFAPAAPEAMATPSTPAAPANPSSPAPRLGGVELLKRIDSQVSFLEGDFSAEYVMVQTKPGEGTTTTNFVIFRRDAEEKYLILILSPPQDKGKGYLKIGNNLWFYDPADRRFTFTSAKDRFQNSNARNSDFTRSSFAVDYRITSTRQEKLGKFDCTVLDMQATSDEVTFPRTILWVDNEDLLVRKKEDYSLSNQLLRTTAIPTYQRFANRFVPVTVVIVDHLRGRVIDGKFQNETTRITISRPSLAPQPDTLYSKGYLEKLGR